MSKTVWQDWEMYVRAWNLSGSRTFLYPSPEPPLNGYRAWDAWGCETYFVPYPPWLSEERKKQARAFAQAQWVQWKAEEAQRREEEEKQRRDDAQWRADFDRRFEAKREAKRRKRQAVKEESERKLSELAVRLAPKDAPNKQETRWPGHPRYWMEFLAAPSCGRPPLASWDPANKTYTLPRGVRISSVQDGWEEESQAYESFALNARKKFRQAWCERKMEMEL
jgi:hypothetical protein